MTRQKNQSPGLRKANLNLTAGEVRKCKVLAPLLLTWFSTAARDLPWRRTRDPYAIWISEIMLQQTRVKTVIPYWQRWMRELPNVRAVAKASPARLHKLWEGLGYYTRVRNLQKAAELILEDDFGTFPESIHGILALPGIGRYTAGAICSIAFNQPTPILDGNVIRVLTRVFGIRQNPRQKQTNALLWKLAELLVLRADQNSQHATRNTQHSRSCSDFNQSLMELGALVCVPKEPKCVACPIRQHCVAYRTRRINNIPNLGKLARPTSRHFIALVVQRQSRFLVRQRQLGVVNSQLWEFPNFELVNGSDVGGAIKQNWNLEPRSLQLLCTIKHSITRYRITLQAYRATLEATAKKSQPTGVWLTPKQLKQFAFTSAHKKILAHLTP